jgi:peptide/nickel transport system ATP-binding protein
MSLLEIDQLSLSLRGTTLLRGVSLALEPGERVGLIGESGSGKSLTVLSVMGLLPEGATLAGSIRFQGQELIGLAERDWAKLRGDRISMIFQEPMTALNPVMRVGKQVAEVLQLHRGLSRASARREAVALLERVGFDRPSEQARAFPHQLSGGQRQRVMIAMAIACRPSLVLADEPTTALDVTVQAQVLELLVALVEEEGSSLLLVSHDLAVVAGVTERVAVMYGGRVVEEGPTTALIAAPQHPYTRALLATSRGIDDLDHELFGHLPAIRGQVPSPGCFPSGCVFRGRCELEVARCAEEPPTTGTAHKVACWRAVATDRAEASS